MENSISVDTDILADILRNKPYAVEWAKKHDEDDVCMTIISLFELYLGAYASHNPSKSKEKVDNLLETTRLLYLSKHSAEEAGKQLARLSKEGRTIEFRDALIGAIALTEKMPLKTNNKSHFQRIKGLSLSD